MPTGVHNNHRRGERSKRLEIPCLFCARIIRILPSVLRVRKIVKYCSRECGYMGSKKPESKTQLNCSFCGTKFIKRTDHLLKKNYCSRSCFSAGREKEYSKWRDPEYIRKYQQEYQIKNRERINELSRRKNKTLNTRKNKEANRISRRGSGKVTKSELENLFLESKGICFWCGMDFFTSYHIDHVYPVALGGKTELQNLVVSCAKCNQRKSDLTPQEFLRRRMKNNDPISDVAMSRFVESK